MAMGMREVDEAAERVMRAMRALDAHRHVEAPTLEREYRRALETYFTATQRTLARDVEAGLDDDDGATADASRLRASVAAHYAAARQALRLARVYQREPATSGRREHECFEAVQRHRDAVRALRVRSREAEQLALPGLAKTRPAAERRAAKTG